MFHLQVDTRQILLTSERLGRTENCVGDEIGNRLVVVRRNWNVLGCWRRLRLSSTASIEATRPLLPEKEEQWRDTSPTPNPINDPMTDPMDRLFQF